eukprot:6435443-Prymnesium_polylepis.1
MVSALLVAADELEQALVLAPKRLEQRDHARLPVHPARLRPREASCAWWMGMHVRIGATLMRAAVCARALAALWGVRHLAADAAVDRRPTREHGNEAEGVDHALADLELELGVLAEVVDPPPRAHVSATNEVESA